MYPFDTDVWTVVFIAAVEIEFHYIGFLCPEIGLRLQYFFISVQIQITNRWCWCFHIVCVAVFHVPQLTRGDLFVTVLCYVVHVRLRTERLLHIFFIFIFKTSLFFYTRARHRICTDVFFFFTVISINQCYLLIYYYLLNLLYSNSTLK